MACRCSGFKIRKYMTFGLQVRCHCCKGKGKRHPATGRSGPRSSGYVKTLDFLDVRHYEGGRSSAKRSGRLYQRRNPWYSFSGTELTSGYMVASEKTTAKVTSDTTGNQSRDPRLGAQCLNHYATPRP